MTTETGMIEVTDNLADFTASFFNADAPATETAAPEQTEVQETPQETEGAEPAEPEVAEVEETAEQKAEKDAKSANRFTKQTRELRETQRQLRELQAQLEALKKPTEQPLTEAKPAATNQAVEAPDPAKYQYGELDPQYIKDTARHEAKLMLEAALAEQRQAEEQKQRETAAQREAETLRTTAAEIEQAGSAKFDDFHEKVVEGGQNGEYPLTKEMFELVTEVSKDIRPDVLYYLASYPEEAEKVAAMSFRQQALWFGRLEAEIKSVASNPPPRKVTSAPPPPSSTPKGSTGRTGANLYSLDGPDALEAMKRALFG